MCSGEQPLKGLVDTRIQARMTVCEALSNLGKYILFELIEYLLIIACGWL